MVIRVPDRDDGDDGVKESSNGLWSEEKLASVFEFGKFDVLFEVFTVVDGDGDVCFFLTACDEYAGERAVYRCRFLARH
jgi:hypothetical protein